MLYSTFQNNIAISALNEQILKKNKFGNIDQIKFALGKYIVHIFRANSPYRRYLMPSLMY